MGDNANMTTRYEHEIPEGYEARIEGNKVIIELKKSEDEKIRKNLIELLLDTSAQDIISHHLELSKVLAYLEKQKEYQNNSNGRNLDELAREYIDGVKQYHPTPTWDLMQTAVCYGYHLREEVESNVESVKLAEWSEEDKVMLNNIVRVVHMKSISPLDEMNDRSKYEKYEDFLKSLPERFNLQPKQEWSEEDEGMYELFSFVIELVENCPDKEKVKNWIKEIKERFINSDYRSVGLHYILKNNSKSWKPSEEQMKCLEDCVNRAREIYNASTSGYNAYHTLSSLYQNLQKLV